MQGLGEGPFVLYYPGQDRFGMWPFLAARWMHLGTPEAFQAFSVLALCSAAIPLARLLGGSAVAVLTLLAPIVLNHLVSWNLFQAGQPYLWQSVALCWAWWACRAAIDSGTSRAGWAAAAGLTLASVLAIWASPLSIPALLGVVALEMLRVRRWRAPEGIAAVAAAALLEARLRGLFYRYVQGAFAQRFITPLRVDVGHFTSNLASVANALHGHDVLLPLGLGGALALLPRSNRTERCGQWILLWLSVCTLPALIVIGHFRMNGFSARYFTLPAYWATAAAVSGAVSLVARLAGRARPAALLVLLLALAVTVPASPRDPLAPLRREAAELTGPEPRVLLGSYWDVYLWASLAPKGSLLPVPVEGEYNRFPGLIRELRAGREALAPCAVDGPDGTAEQYGALLRRTGPELPRGDRAPLCLHRVERAARAVGSPP